MAVDALVVDPVAAVVDLASYPGHTPRKSGLVSTVCACA